MLTELDNCILGVIWREGPMSAYGVRAHFGQSTTTTWSSSTGTVYPAIKRLVAAGLLDAADRTGPRNSQLLTVTDQGLEALRRWLVTVTPELGSSTADPIRTRAHFLAALEPQTRAKVLALYRAATDESLATLETHAHEPATDAVTRSEHLGTIGALMELRARREWLDLVEREFAAMDSRSSG